MVLGCGLVVFADLAMQRSAFRTRQQIIVFLASRVLAAVSITTCGVGPTSPIKSPGLAGVEAVAGHHLSGIPSKLKILLLHIHP